METTENDESIYVTELPVFLDMFLDWHGRQIATLMHMQTVPPGTEVEFEDDDALVLEGDALRGFQLGVSMGLHYLGTLPFTPGPGFEGEEPTLQ